MVPASEKAAELMRSLSHPQRLLALCALGGEEKTVAELRQELGIGQVPLSQQLMRLRADGVVGSRRDGTNVYYRITRPEVLGVIEALHAAFCLPPAAGASRRRHPRINESFGDENKRPRSPRPEPSAPTGAAHGP
ncbi:MAG: ArsR/SmtB family transcription factor [Beijerinckiaceae bacterium]